METATRVVKRGACWCVRCVSVPRSRCCISFLLLHTVALLLIFARSLFDGRQETSHLATLSLLDRDRGTLNVACETYSSWLGEYCLPSFLVIGGMKCGTSTLYNIMIAHPQIKPPRVKEMQFLSGGVETLYCDPPEQYPDKSRYDLYLSYFPWIDKHSGVITGEWTASYLSCWCCAAAARRLLPHVKLIAQLRDPMALVESAFLYKCWSDGRKVNRQPSRRKRKPPSLCSLTGFDDFVAQQLPRLRTCLEKAEGAIEREVKCIYHSSWLSLSTAMLASSLQLWLQHFGAKQMLVTYLEDLSSDPGAVMRSIETHLGLQRYEYGKVLHSVYNSRGSYGFQHESSSRPVSTNFSMSSDTYSKLYDFYRKDVLKLKMLADSGAINPLPKSWMDRWHLS